MSCRPSRDFYIWMTLHPALKGWAIVANHHAFVRCRRVARQHPGQPAPRPAVSRVYPARSVPDGPLGRAGCRDTSPFCAASASPTGAAPPTSTRNGFLMPKGRAVVLRRPIIPPRRSGSFALPCSRVSCISRFTLSGLRLIVFPFKPSPVLRTSNDLLAPARPALTGFRLRQTPFVISQMPQVPRRERGILRNRIYFAGRFPGVGPGRTGHPAPTPG